MEVLFKCLQEGKRYYGVRLNGEEIFVGSTEECERFISLHKAKVNQEYVDDQRTPRSRPFAIRTYRQARSFA